MQSSSATPPRLIGSNMNISPEKLNSDHTPEAIAQRIAAATQHSYVGDFVLGAVDGAITTFAIVAGAAGAGLNNGVVFVLGMANVLADGLSMAAGNFLRARSDQQLVARMRRMEEMHIEQIPEGEREEIRQIFQSKGFAGDVLEQVVTVITQDRRRWVDTMLTEEWGLQITPPTPWKAGLATFVAFLLAGLVPLFPVIVALGGHAQDTFTWSIGLTGITFFLVGYARGHIIDRRPWAAAFETLAIGGTAAAVAYAVGKMLERLAAA
jgi:VIT1/CCC1 family predicted Fe2+/Mn2+ transporter